LIHAYLQGIKLSSKNLWISLLTDFPADEAAIVKGHLRNQIQKW